MVHLVGEAELLEVVQALTASACFSDRLNRGQQQRHENADNGDHNKEFNKRKTGKAGGALAARQGGHGLFLQGGGRGATRLQVCGPIRQLHAKQRQRYAVIYRNRMHAAVKGIGRNEGPAQASLACQHLGSTWLSKRWPPEKP